MRNVCVDDDRATGGECRRGVTAGNRVSEREVTCAENCDWPNRTKHRANVRFWQWFAIRDRVIDACINPSTFVEQIGEHPQLSTGASAFADESRVWERRFERCTLDERITESLNVVGDLS